MKSLDFIATLGVNTHIGPELPPYAADNVLAAMEYIGVVDYRDAQVPSNPLRYEPLAKAGKRMCCLVGSNIAPAIQYIEALEKLYPGAIRALEGPNEINNIPGYSWGGVAGVAGAQLFMTEFAAAQAKSVLLASKPFLNFTNYPDESSSALIGNFHTYPPPLTGASSGGVGYLTQAAKMPGKPVWCTEFGNWGAGTHYSDEVGAGYLLTLWCDLILAGCPMAYAYELFDEGTKQDAKANPELNFGLFYNNGSPKPVATAIATLKAILSNGSQASFTESPAPLTVTGAHVKSLALQDTPTHWRVLVWQNQLGVTATSTPSATAIVLVRPTLPKCVEIRPSRDQRGPRTTSHEKSGTRARHPAYCVCGVRSLTDLARRGESRFDSRTHLMTPVDFDESKLKGSNISSRPD